MMTQSTEKIQCSPSPLRQRLRMFCFPYAGGNARTIYGQWEEELYFDADVVPVDLPGRGSKAGQKLLSDLQQIAAHLAKEIADQSAGPYIFYGHSVGALVSFEVARHLSNRFDSEPNAIFAAAFRAPHTPVRRKPVHQMSDNDLLAHVSRLGGVPTNVLSEPALLQLTLPILRADLRLSEDYVLSDCPCLRCPIYVYGGDADPIVAPNEYQRWSELTSGKCEVTLLKGGHFFHEISQPALFEEFAKKTQSIRALLGRGLV